MYNKIMKLFKILPLLICLLTNSDLTIAQSQPSGNSSVIRVCDDLNADEETSTLRKEWILLLREKKFTALEESFKDREVRTNKGEFGDQVLYRLTKFTDTAEPELEPLLNEWVRVYPSSFIALLARGHYHEAVGWKKRGNKFSDNTSKDQFEAMSESFKKAAIDLTTSSKLKSSSVLPYPGLLQIISSISENKNERLDILIKANKIDPKNYIVRRMALYTFVPKWGGSFEEMDHIVAQSRNSTVSESDIRRLEFISIFEKASHFKSIEKRISEALPYFTQAAKLCDSYKAWAEVSNIQYIREDWVQVEAATNQYMRLRPDTAWGYNRRGWALEKQGRLKEAIVDYEKSSDLGNDYAQNKIGYFYMTGNGLPKDLSKARNLFEKANAQGNKNAKSNLESLSRMSSSN
jgi:tetratricopeptide (TPR) repeat protein